MALTEIGGILNFPSLWLPYVSVSTKGVLDATGERLATIAPIFKAGNIRNVYIRTATVTEEDNLKVSLQGVDVNGLPDGTILGAGNAGYTTATLADTDDNVWIGPFQLGVDVAVTRGQFISVVFEWSSYSDGNLSLAYGQAVSYIYNQYICTDITATPGTWIKETYGTFCVALQYDDGTFAFPFCHPGQTAPNLSTSTTPDEIGNHFSLPFPARAVGIYGYFDADYDLTASLQNEAGTVLGNCTFDDVIRYGTGVGYHVQYFDGDPASYVNLTKDTNYRVVLTPTSASNSPVRKLDFPTSACRAAIPGAMNFQLTSRVDAGEWSQTDTEMIYLGILVDQIDDGSNAGGGPMGIISPVISGGHPHYL